ncbi:MAG TPA: hypothetical protein DCM05_15200 [Elusimicrobia bacterium]|nr:hypothetical protein [Elusimicrobiota bacterium]
MKSMKRSALAVLLALAPMRAALALDCEVSDPQGGASEAISSCIETALATGDRVVALAPGRYLLSTKIDLDAIAANLNLRPDAARRVSTDGLTIQTQGVDSGPACLDRGARPCAVLAARDDFDRDGEGPILASKEGSRLTFKYIAIDGNGVRRRQRVRVSPDSSALPHFNAQIHSCDGCTFKGFASVDALRGSGLEFIGADTVFDTCLFRDNGAGANLTSYYWADGLTALNAPRIRIRGSKFLNNSDIDLILGGAPGGVIEDNVLGIQAGSGRNDNFAFAAFMLDNFMDSQPGDFTGLTASSNRIDCGPESLCGIGMALGPGGWYRARAIRGGTLSGNTLRRTRQGILFAGAQGTEVSGNSMDMIGGWALPDGSCRTSYIDISGEASLNAPQLPRTPDVVAPTRGRLTACFGDPLKLAQLRSVSFEKFYDAKDFVERLHRRYLGREASEAEAADWASRVLNGDMTRAQAEDSIAFSPEAQAHWRAEGVPALYQRCLGRDPEEGGLAAWRTQALEAAYRGICLDEPERQRFLREEPIRVLYRQCLGREASDSEASRWGSSGLSRAAAANGICASAEARRRVVMPPIEESGSALLGSNPEEAHAQPESVRAQADRPQAGIQPTAVRSNGGSRATAVARTGIRANSIKASFSGPSRISATSVSSQWSR